MRAYISDGGIGWIRGLDYKKLIIIVFLLRLIAAEAYDVFVSVTDRDILLPDSKFYSVKGRYVDLMLQGVRGHVGLQMLPSDKIGRAIFVDTVISEKGLFPSDITQITIYSYMVGIIYYLFGYHAIWVRVFNILLSIASTYLLFDVTKRYFGILAANMFLVIALFLSAQSIYSITMSRDFLRLFAGSFLIWSVYGGYAWLTK